MSENNGKKKWYYFKRNAELKTIINHLPNKKDIKILEIGGWDGFMAKQVHDLGYEIKSTDLNPKYPQYFPVTVGNASKLDFESDEFDVIFTSHLIVEVKEVASFFDECRRVLKNDGIMIHVLPTTTWSIVTNIWHYMLLPKFFLNWIRPNTSSASTNSLDQNLEAAKKQSTKSKIIDILFLHPIGANPSFLHDILSFTKRRWKKVFKNEGFDILTVEDGPYFYSGFGIFRNKLLKSRKVLANNGFSGSVCFVLKNNPMSDKKEKSV